MTSFTFLTEFHDYRLCRSDLQSDRLLLWLLHTTKTNTSLGSLDQSGLSDCDSIWWQQCVCAVGMKSSLLNAQCLYSFCHCKVWCWIQPDKRWINDLVAHLFFWHEITITLHSDWSRNKGESTTSNRHRKLSDHQGFNTVYCFHKLNMKSDSWHDNIWVCVCVKFTTTHTSTDLISSSFME